MVQDVLNSLHHLCLVQRRILPLQLYQLEPEQALRQKLRRSFTAGMREALIWLLWVPKIVPQLEIGTSVPEIGTSVPEYKWKPLGICLEAHHLLNFI